MNETLTGMNRYVPRYNPLTGESYYREYDAISYLESWREAMIGHYNRLGILDEPEQQEEEIDFSAPEWNNLVLN